VIPATPRQGAASVASTLARNVQYQGRKASRQGSELRRQAILDAAMRIVVRDGVRGVRHRAVATEAGVPLSATTYYFKDIDDLLNDAFAQYVERSAVFMAKLWSNTEEMLRALIARGDGSPEARAQLADEIARLIAEQAFRQEALLNPRLASLVLAHQDILLQGGRQMLEVLGSRDPVQDAQVLTAIIGRMEYQGLLASTQADADREMLGILTRFMQWVLG